MSHNYNFEWTNPMEWIYLSPHLDDVALSCGGLVWEQVQDGNKVSIWTICAGDPPTDTYSDFAKSFHERWGAVVWAVATRRAEDIVSCARLGAVHRHFPIPDCIYRVDPQSGKPLYLSEEDLFGGLHPSEGFLVERVRDLIREQLPTQVNLVCPLTIGRHVDHLLTRAAAEQLGILLWYYADYPYIERLDARDMALFEGMESTLYPISEAGLQAWQDAVAAHASQISTFWLNEETMREAIRNYHRRVGGIRLWRKRG